jgi:hypothetical protein
LSSGPDVQAQPFGCVHLVEQAIQELPHGQVPLHTTQQPVELSWHDATPIAATSATPQMRIQRAKALQW